MGFYCNGCLLRRLSCLPTRYSKSHSVTSFRRLLVLLDMITSSRTVLLLNVDRTCSGRYDIMAWCNGNDPECRYPRQYICRTSASQSEASYVLYCRQSYSGGWIVGSSPDSCLFSASCGGGHLTDTAQSTICVVCPHCHMVQKWASMTEKTLRREALRTDMFSELSFCPEQAVYMKHKEAVQLYFWP